MHDSVECCLAYVELTTVNWQRLESELIDEQPES